MPTRPGRRSAAQAHAPLSLKARAIALLAQREHSEAELRRKLLRHARSLVDRQAGEGAPGEAAPGEAAANDPALRVDPVIDWLRAEGHLSETRFVESRVHARAARFGNLRIRQELAQHGLALPPEAAQALKASELERATEVWRRKFGAAPVDAAQRARQSRFLAQRGFSADVIARVMRDAGARIGDEPASDP